MAGFDEKGCDVRPAAGHFPEGGRLKGILHKLTGLSSSHAPLSLS